MMRQVIVQFVHWQLMPQQRHHLNAHLVQKVGITMTQRQMLQITTNWATVLYVRLGKLQIKSNLRHVPTVLLADTHQHQVIQNFIAHVYFVQMESTKHLLEQAPVRVVNLDDF
jgi:hypothetical protein